MDQPDASMNNGDKIKSFFRNNLRFRSSIYSRVVIIITVSSIILFFLFGIIFRSVYESNLNTVIRHAARAPNPMRPSSIV